jgi:chaperonin GroEL
LEDLIFSEDARIKMLSGVTKLASAVQCTMGPKGRNVLIQQKFGSHLTKDGVTVAKNVKLKDQIEMVAANLVKEVASRTADEAGDGTTTATVLAHELYSLGIKNITAGANPLEIKQGMDKASKDVLDALKLNAVEVTTYDEIVNIATISANGDKNIGQIVAKANLEVGVDGLITVEEGKGLEDELKITKGLQFYNGYLSPYFVNNTAKMEVQMENPYVLLYNDRIPNLKAILPFLEKAQTNKKPILIICNTMDEEALNTLVVNKMRGNLDVCVVKSPGFGNIQDYLEDLQVMTGGNIQNPSKGVVITDVSEDLGVATSVTVTNKSCSIVCKDANEDLVLDRVNELKEQLKTDTPLASQIKQRIAKLAGGVAVIKVQSPTEIETKEKKDRVDDALGAIKAAQEEGIVIGGGTALYKIDLSKNLQNLEGDENIGYKIVLDAIKRPFIQILKNAGLSHEKISMGIDKERYCGYNVRTNEYGNLFDLGVIDSYKVQRVALTNAISVASTLLTTECIIPLSEDKA